MAGKISGTRDATRRDRKLQSQVAGPFSSYAHSLLLIQHMPVQPCQTLRLCCGEDLQRAAPARPSDAFDSPT